MVMIELIRNIIRPITLSVISIKSFADAGGSSNITRLLIIMLLACQEFVFEETKKIGRRERRKGNESLVY